MQPSLEQFSTLPINTPISIPSAGTTPLINEEAEFDMDVTRGEGPVVLSPEVLPSHGQTSPKASASLCIIS